MLIISLNKRVAFMSRYGNYPRLEGKKLIDNKKLESII